MKEPEVEAPASDGRERKHIPGIRAELAEPMLHGDLHAARDVELVQRLAIPDTVGIEDLTAGRQRFEHLFDEEGVALGGCIHSFEKLGAYSDHYERNRYGADYAAGLYGGLPTDRLHMTLRLDNPEVEGRMTGRIPPRAARDIRGLGQFRSGIPESRALIFLPSDIDRIVATDMKTAIRWRYELRETIEAAFAEDFVICGFIPAVAENGDRSAYLIERHEGPAAE